MRRISGFILIAVGFILWYLGGYYKNPHYVNLGIASLILGVVVLSIAYGGDTPKFAPCSSYCEFLEKLVKDAGLKGKPVVIPPYENLPRGGILLPPRDNYPISLGRLDRESALLPDGSLLVSPPPGWEVVEMTIEKVGTLSGVGSGYASSAVLAILNVLGIGGGKVFELEDSIEIYAEYLCAPSIFDPVVGAILISISLGNSSLYSIESVERRKDYLILKLRPLGGIERWM